MARTIEDNIVAFVLPFVQTNITNANWRLKEAAIMAFGSILEGPTPAKLTPIVAQAMPVSDLSYHQATAHTRFLEY
jgi:importin subunit beta-1